MSVKTGQAWAGRFTTHSSTGAAVDADSTPTGTLIVDGDTNAASVTITDSGVGIYKWAVTLPTLTAGQTVQMQISATVATVAATAVVASAQADTVLESDTYGKVDTEVADIQGRLPAALAADGSIKASLQSVLGTAFTEGAAGRIAANLKTFFNVASATGTQDVIPTVTTVGTLTTYTGNTPQTGDSFARIGAAGAGLTAVGDTAGVTTLLSRLSAARAGYLDNLSAGAVALQSTLSGIVAAVWTVGNMTDAAANRIADHVLRRSTANVEASSYGDTLGGRSLYGAVARLAHKVATALGTMTIYKSDDSASLTTATLTTDATADPVTTIDPAA